MATQLNIKLQDEKVKREAEKIAEQLGFSLGSVMRGFLLHFIRTKRIEFTLENLDDTPDDLTGAKLEQALLQSGEDPVTARKHGEAYDDMLQAKKDGTLIAL